MRLACLTAMAIPKHFFTIFFQVSSHNSLVHMIMPMDTGVYVNVFPLFSYYQAIDCKYIFRRRQRMFRRRLPGRCLGSNHSQSLHKNSIVFSYRLSGFWLHHCCYGKLYFKFKKGWVGSFKIPSFVIRHPVNPVLHCKICVVGTTTDIQGQIMYKSIVTKSKFQTNYKW